jgi:methylthioribulose-1-phosphate dehydratase
MARGQAIQDVTATLLARGQVDTPALRQDGVLSGPALDGATPGSPAFDQLAVGLARFTRACYARGWALGTSGNFSVVAGEAPLRLAVTGSGLDKGALTPDDIVCVDAQGRLVAGSRRPSAETGLHLAILRVRAARAVAHTHSVWGTLLSLRHASQGGVLVQGLEMLKGLAGVTTHQAQEWVPILENSQDYDSLSAQVEQALAAHPAAHGFLLRGHGLYTWGDSLDELKRHLEILEFLFEVVARGGAAVPEPVLAAYR